MKITIGDQFYGTRIGYYGVPYPQEDTLFIASEDIEIIPCLSAKAALVARHKALWPHCIQDKQALALGLPSNIIWIPKDV